MKKHRIDPDDRPEGLTHNPFAALRPDGAPAPAPTPTPLENKPGTPHDVPLARILVQREKKGRAGKTVTRIQGLPVGKGALAELARELKKALGCGASVEADDVLLQGAQTERAAQWLRKRFDADVTVGN